MTDETKTPETSAPETEQPYVLKVQFGFLFSFKATAATVNDKMHALADQFVTDVKALDVAPFGIHLIDGEAMTAEDFEKMKKVALENAERIKQLIGAIQSVLPEGAEVSVVNADTGEALAASDSAEPESGVTEVTISGSDEPAIELGEGAFRVPGSRTVQ